MSKYVGCCKERANSFVAKLRSGLVYVIHCSFPTIRRYSACSSLSTGMLSLSSLLVLFAAVPGVVAALHVVMPASSNIVAVYPLLRLIS